MKRNIFYGLMLLSISAFAKEVRIYVDIVGDLFHAGHVEFLKKAKAEGDYLIVGVLPDSTVEGYKRRPVWNLEERAKSISACKYVDEVIVGCSLRATEEFIQEHKIDFVIHGDDFDPASPICQDQYAVPIKLGIFKTVPYTQGISTTDTIDRIKQRFTE